MTKFLNISTDDTLGGVSPSDEIVVSQKAIKTYVDNQGGGNAPIKSIDAEIVGSLTVASNGDVSGFSSSNYLLYPGSFDMTDASSFEMVLAFTPSSSNNRIFAPLANSGIGLSLQKNSNKLRVWVYNYQTSTTLNDISGVTTLSADTKYYAKVVYDGTNYTVSLSTDGSTWNTEATAAAVGVPGITAQGYAIGKTSSFFGNLTAIHMAECYIKKDGILVWQGTDCPGLHQRATNRNEVVEFQAPSVDNNYIGYRKYADGYVEIWGGGTTNGGNATQVTLPVTMADTNYNVFIQGQTGADGYTNAQWQVMPVSTTTSPKSTTSFYAQASITGYNLFFYWEVKGMAA